MLSTGAIVPEVRVGREWELEGKRCKHVVCCYVHVILVPCTACFTRAGEHVLCVYKYPLCYVYIFCREVIELRERTKQGHPKPTA